MDFMCCILVVEFIDFQLCFMLVSVTYPELFVCRIINSLFHALLFQRKGLFWLIWPLLCLKPPRLKKIRMEMKPKNPEIPAQ
jgi:hypothetical protein